MKHLGSLIVWKLILIFRANLALICIRPIVPKCTDLGWIENSGAAWMEQKYNISLIVSCPILFSIRQTAIALDIEARTDPCAWFWKKKLRERTKNEVDARPNVQEVQILEDVYSLPLQESRYERPFKPDDQLTEEDIDAHLARVYTQATIVCSCPCESRRSKHQISED